MIAAELKKVLGKLPGDKSLKTELVYERHQERKRYVRSEERNGMHGIWKCTENPENWG